MRDARPEFRRRKLRWFDRLRGLPLDSYEASIHEDSYVDLAAGLTVKPAADEVHVVPVKERIRLRGFDTMPAAEILYLTVVRKGSRWSVVGDAGLDSLGMLSARNLWDFDDVEQVRDGPVLVLTQGSRSVAESIAADARAASRFVRRRWPLAWNGRVVVLIPESVDQLGRVLQTTFDLGPFVAFAASSAERVDGEFRLGGHRVYVQPETFFDNPDSYQADTLSHELLHIATREDSGAFVPAWLDEGVAQIYGEREVPGTPTLAATERAGQFDGEPPDDWQFTIGDRALIRLSYEESSDFVDHLRDRFGRARVARFYDTLGAQSPVSFGTPRYHLDHAARAVFGRSFSSLRGSWASSVRRRF